MTMKLNQKSGTVVTSFSQTKFSQKTRSPGIRWDSASVKAAVAAFEDLRATRLSRQIHVRQAHFRSRARLAGNLVVLRRPPVCSYASAKRLRLKQGQARTK